MRRQKVDNAPLDGSDLQVTQELKAWVGGVIS